MQDTSLSLKNIAFVVFVVLIALGNSSCRSSKKKSPDKKNTPKTVKNSSGTGIDKSRNEVVDVAQNFMGVKYLYGGTTRSGIDCSGLIGNAYKKVGISLPRSSKEMAFAGKEIDKKNLNKGDLVFFDDKPGGRLISHVGMVTQVKSSNSVIFIHSTVQKGVMEDDLYSNYWIQRFIKAVTILGK